MHVAAEQFWFGLMKKDSRVRQRVWYAAMVHCDCFEVNTFKRARRILSCMLIYIQQQIVASSWNIGLLDGRKYWCSASWWQVVVSLSEKFQLAYTVCKQTFI